MRKILKPRRRDFLLGAGALPLAGLASGSALSWSSAARAASTDGYKALVCLFLKGGIDSHDTLLPFDQASYDGYADIRSDLLGQYENQSPGSSSRSRAELLELSPDNVGDFGSRRFAFTREFTPIRDLFHDGNAAIVGNVGPLVETLTRPDFEMGGIQLPVRLFSHNDQQSTWMSAGPEGSQLGWGGLFADALLAAQANTDPVFTALSASPSNDVFLAGTVAQPYQIAAGGVAETGLIDGSVIPDDSQLAAILRDHFNSAGADQSNLFARDYVSASRRANAANALYNDALSTGQDLMTVFPDSSVAGQLQSVIEAISIRSTLGASRQVFFVTMGGYDTHSNQANTLPQLQTALAEAIKAFFDATVELGVENDVTLFTASDFGRTLSINGDGTDHGWGGHQLVVGGAVNGNRIYGSVPEAVLGHDLDAGSGRLIPSVSVEQMAAPLGRWFGLNDAEIATALPGLSGFSADELPLLNLS